MNNDFAWLRCVWRLQACPTTKLLMLAPLTLGFVATGGRGSTFMNAAPTMVSFRLGRAGVKSRHTSRTGHGPPVHTGAFVSPANESGSHAAPPPTRRDSVVEKIHGVLVPDPYRWLEDSKSSETRAWTDAKNRYTRHLLDR